MEIVAPEMTVPSVLLVTSPLRENVFAICPGDDGDVVVLFPPPQAMAMNSNKKAHARCGIGTIR